MKTRGADQKEAPLNAAAPKVVNSATAATRAKVIGRRS